MQVAAISSSIMKSSISENAARELGTQAGQGDAGLCPLLDRRRFVLHPGRCSDGREFLIYFTVGLGPCETINFAAQAQGLVVVVGVGVGVW